MASSTMASMIIPAPGVPAVPMEASVAVTTMSDHLAQGSACIPAAGGQEHGGNALIDGGAVHVDGGAQGQHEGGNIVLSAQRIGALLAETGRVAAEEVEVKAKIIAAEAFLKNLTGLMPANALAETE